MDEQKSINGETLKKKTIAGFFWSFAERIGAQLVGFVVSVILARLLMPEDYGIIAIVWIFISLSDVLVNSGLGSSLIQKQKVDDLDFSTVFYFSFAMSLVLYSGLFVAAPYIAKWYNIPLLTPVLRVMGLRLLIASVATSQKAKVLLDMDYRKFFFSTIGGTLFSAVVGIAIAYLGGGVWALVAQELTNMFVDMMILFLTVDWRPKWMFSLSRLKGLFSYGWKLLATSLLNTAYEQFQSLYIGKQYTTEALAFYSRGRQFPHLIIDNVNASISSVLLPAISTVQNDLEAVKNMTSRGMRIGSYVMTPIMLGLAAVSDPLIRILLTDKWIDCVPYLQLFCVNGMILPLLSVNNQAVYAIGRSDIALKLNIAKKLIGLVLMVCFVRVSILAMVWAYIAGSMLALCMDAIVNKRLFDYGVWDTICDVVPNWLLSGGMALVVYMVGMLELPLLLKLVAMILSGVMAYVLLSAVFRVDSFRYILNMLKGFVKKRQK